MGGKARAECPHGLVTTSEEMTLPAEQTVAAKTQAFHDPTIKRRCPGAPTREEGCPPGRPDGLVALDGVTNPTCRPQPAGRSQMGCQAVALPPRPGSSNKRSRSWLAAPHDSNVFVRPDPNC
jgi:hypothetical protein